MARNQSNESAQCRNRLNLMATEKKKVLVSGRKITPLIEDEFYTFVPHALSFRIFAADP